MLVRLLRLLLVLTAILGLQVYGAAPKPKA